MKHSREIKVGVLAVVCGCLLYFGFNFLKGVNIFSPTRGYIGMFDCVNGLTEQSPVYIQGYKVGLVETITYDFARNPAFTVGITINKDISLPYGTEMALVADGLISGMAIELRMPQTLATNYHQRGDTLPTTIVPSLIENMQTGLLAHLDSLINECTQLMNSVNDEMDEGSLHATLQHIETLTRDLTITGKDLQRFTHHQFPQLVNKTDSAITDLQGIMNDVRRAELSRTIYHLDSTILKVNQVLASDSGTLGLLLNDDAAYRSLNKAIDDLDKAIINVDTVVESVKAHPWIKKRIPKNTK